VTIYNVILGSVSCGKAFFFSSQDCELLEDGDSVYIPKPAQRLAYSGHLIEVG
jgi:hypothetical protein